LLIIIFRFARKNYANPIKAPVLDLRQSSEKLSHSNKSPETQNSQIQDQKPNNLVTYPIQRGSKDGIGNKENIKQNIQNNLTTKLQTIPITPQQQQILSLLYHFRFLDRSQIQKFMNHKNHKRILLWLNDLNEKTTKAVIEQSWKHYANPIKLTKDYLPKNALEKSFKLSQPMGQYINDFKAKSQIFVALTLT